MLVQALTPDLSYASDEECGSSSSSISEFSLGDFPEAQAPNTKSPTLVLGFDDALSTLSTAFCDDVRRKDVPEPPPKKCHPVYYFEDGSIELLAEDTHYNVHRSMIRRHAPSWLATLDRTPGTKTLADVSCEELDVLLAILYPESCARWALQSLAEWTAALRLSTMWSFPTARELAIRKLEPLASVIEKLVLARAHDVDQWLRPAFVELCTRSAKLSRADAARLKAHPDDVVLVFTVREEIKEGRLPREEAFVTDRVDAWLTGKSFEFPPAKVERSPPPPGKTVSTSSAVNSTAKAAGSSSFDDVRTATPTPLGSSVPKTGVPVQPKRGLWQSIAEPSRVRTPTAPIPVQPPKAPQVPLSASVFLPKPVVQAESTSDSTSSLKSPITVAEEALTSSRKSRFDIAVRLITSENAEEFVSFVVSKLNGVQPSFDVPWRIDLHQDFSRSLMRHALRTDAFVPLCADILEDIANRIAVGTRDIDSADLGSDDEDLWQGSYLGETRARRDVKAALATWRSFLAEGTQRQEEPYILKSTTKTISSETYRHRGENLERLAKALVANRLLEPSDLGVGGQQ
ncbi:unnamed protein product [Peniophora sp. CBMAI 1063]|nr:unnamed protein product [Peniophora sp. CBMAI 1063]